MNKEEYFNKSNQLNLPNRCPILDRCSRRASTIFLLGYYDVDTSKVSDVHKFLVDEGQLNHDFTNRKIPVQGENPSMIKGRNNIYFHDVCPEVNLFDKINGIFFAKGVACISADWDNFRDKPKERIDECRHFSECPEFSKYKYENELAQKINNFSQINEVKDYLINDEIKKALKLTKEICNDHDLLDYGQSCILLLNRYKELSSKEINGIEHSDYIRIEKNKIVKSILSILENIRELMN